MTPTFVAAPWRISKDDANGIEVVSCTGEIVHRVIYPSVTDDLSSAMRHSIIQRERANAFLICAAPRLLAACEGAISLANEGMNKLMAAMISAADGAFPSER